MILAPIPTQDQPITLIGAGGHARVVASSARRCGLRLAAVLVSDLTQIGQTFAGLTVQADTGATEGLCHVAIGANAIRRRVVEARPGADWVTIIDPSAKIADDAVIEPGCLIGMGACVQTGVRIGRHVIVNTGAIVEHDCIIGDFAHIAPGAILTGAVQVGAGVLIGAGAVVLPGLSIAEGATVGAGAVVTRSVEAGVTVAGSPARAKAGHRR